MAWDLLVTAYGISFAAQGSHLGPLLWEHGALTAGPPGKSPKGDVLIASLGEWVCPAQLVFGKARLTTTCSVVYLTTTTRKTRPLPSSTGRVLLLTL